MKPLYMLVLVVAFTWRPILGAETQTIRIATYNVSLYGKKAGEIRERLSDGVDPQASDIAAVVQMVRPDILLVNELDYDEDSATAKLLASKFFAKGQDKHEGIQYPYVYSIASNTGVDSDLDLNRNGTMGEPNDCWGYGVYPGQYAMAVFSRFPLNQNQVRTFQTFLWKDLPGALRPIEPDTKQPYFDDTVWNRLRLSSKNHVDVPIQVKDDFVIHLLASHPTPPVFDGPEDRNGCRNHDEIAFWKHYLNGSSALKDGQGVSGGLPADRAFVIMGDLNSDPVDGDGKRDAINDLISHPRVRDPQPRSRGAVADATGKAAKKQKGNPAMDTSNFGGNLRVDFVLPSRLLALKDSGVFWPPRKAPERRFIDASDHRMVWIEVRLP